MIEITIGVDKNGQDTTVSSEDVAAVVFPCSDYESLVLWRELQSRYGFKSSELIQPRMTRPFLVDWVEFLGEKKPIQVSIDCWQVKGVWLCFVGPIGDMFSYNLVEDWLKGHFSCTWDRGTRRAFFDPMNFHNCASALKEAIEVQR